MIIQAKRNRDTMYATAHFSKLRSAVKRLPWRLRCQDKGGCFFDGVASNQVRVNTNPLKVTHVVYCMKVTSVKRQRQFCKDLRSTGKTPETAVSAELSIKPSRARYGFE
eukprot:PhF_6_TR13414/c1_g1_i1/m.21358